MPDGQKQESMLKPAGSTERLGYCERGSSVAVAVVIVVVASEAARLKFTPRDRSEAGDDEVVGGICWTSSSRLSTSMITGDVLDEVVSVGLSLVLADAGGSFELGDSAGRLGMVIGRDEPKKESILG